MSKTREPRLNDKDVRPSSQPAPNSRPGLLCWFMALIIVFAIHDVRSLQASNSKPTEYEVKAAYLYNFGRFVEWPSRTDAPQSNAFTICVVGQDHFGAALNNLADETIAGKNVVVKRLQTSRDATNCRILYISESEGNQLNQTLAALEGSSVLTVSDMPRFSQRGGMIQFVLDGNRVRFEINLASAEHAGLTLSSELLKLAVNVRRSPASGD